MRLLRAFMFGVFLWLLIFFEASSLLYVFRINYGSDLYFLVHFIFLILFVLLCGLGYFWVPKMKGDFVHGLLLGVVFVIVMLILDFFITVPFFFVKDYNFINRSDILIGEILVIVVCGLIGVGKWRR